jgi:protein-arginine kinase activator protein McsA
MKKEELVAFIKEARGIKDEKPVRKKKLAVKIKVTKAELKARIRALQASKGEALEASDLKKAALLRHRISRLKKRSRRVVAAA